MPKIAELWKFGAFLAQNLELILYRQCWVALISFIVFLRIFGYLTVSRGTKNDVINDLENTWKIFW